MAVEECHHGRFGITSDVSTPSYVKVLLNVSPSRSRVRLWVCAAPWRQASLGDVARFALMGHAHAQTFSGIFTGA